MGGYHSDLSTCEQYVCGLLPASADPTFKVLAIIILALTAFAASVFKVTVSFAIRLVVTNYQRTDAFIVCGIW
jgi:hypothetical protein